ncbi:MAG: PP2C family protein-serine/threonine phosphatase [Bdellovibrionia bacterium]
MSKTLIYLGENPCDKAHRKPGVVSEFYTRQLKDLEINPEIWAESFELFQACSKLSLGSAQMSNQGVDKVVIVASSVQLMQPYLVALIQVGETQRLAVIAMDGFTTAAANTIFLADAQGNTLWAADGESYLKSALLDTGVTVTDIVQFTQKAIDSSTPEVRQAGREGLISSVKLGEDWAVHSLSYEPTTLQPVAYATSQSLLLAAGFIFLCLFIGRRGSVLVTRPLNELSLHAERLGKGDFSSRITVFGTDEISVVKAAFNLMTDRILQLIESTKQAVALERELELAEQIQKMLIPETSLTKGSTRIASYLQSANHCGGDWWGYLEHSRGEGRSPLILLMIGDVTGHGTSSALITATVRGGLSILESWLKTLPNQEIDPRLINNYFNQVVYQAAKGAIGMTFFTAIIDPDEEKLRVANAGHNLPYALMKSPESSDLEVKSIGKASVPLGYAPDTVYEEMETYPWISGSRLVLYTDGLVECMENGTNLYDRRQLRKALKSNGRLQADYLLNKLLADRKKRIKDLPSEDDVTVVICEALSS